MIVKEPIMYRGIPHYRIYSDSNRYIVHDGQEICQICVPQDEPFECVEGDEIPNESAESILDILMGGE